MTETMRKIVATETGQLVQEHVLVPDPAPGEALLELESVGICGSDLHAIRGRHPFLKLPFNPGHEVVGRVLANTTATPPVGCRVVIEPPLPCGHCKMCSTGRANICPTRGFFGSNQPQGGMADYMTIRADRLHAIDGALPSGAAALIEPLATPMHALRITGGVMGKHVAILGAGTIGLLALIACLEGGASSVVVTDISQAKLDRAQQLGATHVLDASLQSYPQRTKALVGETLDVVIDCVAAESTLASALQMIERGGTVIILGVPPTSMTVDVPWIQENQIRLQGSTVYTGPDFPAAIDIATRRAADLETLISGVVDLDHVPEGFDLAQQPESVKILIKRSNPGQLSTRTPNG